jgi:hypothetical protein
MASTAAQSVKSQASVDNLSHREAVLTAMKY